jgi:hypothetical protein
MCLGMRIGVGIMIEDGNLDKRRYRAPFLLHAGVDSSFLKVRSLESAYGQPFPSPGCRHPDVADIVR